MEKTFRAAVGRWWGPREQNEGEASRHAAPAHAQTQCPRVPAWAAAAAWGSSLLAILVLVAVKLDLTAQFCLSFSVLGGMIVLRHTSSLERSRLFFLLCSGFLTFRYLYWRTTSTLGYNGLPDFLFMLLLYGAELYGIVVALLGLFVNSRPLQRTAAPLIRMPGALPRVDVFVPTYNEPPELLEVTLRAALDMRYPCELLNVYLLDDGGTQQKLTQPDAAKAAEARARADAMRAMVERHGGIYLARERNEHAKAGNINAALTCTDGDLIAIFDADHVPTADFLEKTVGYFQRDEKLYLVQTPHFFINPDPLEKNLGMFGKMPPENEMFYSVVQRGLDFWNASFFCGSAAVLRRRCLEEIGGISGTSITEDAETALTLHALGYHSAYVSEALVSGLQPETFASFIVQRVRWAQGMIQLFLLRNPLRLAGLSLPQRLCYFSNAFFWFFCYARLVFVFAPIMYLVFGLQFYNATIPQFFAYGLPQMIAAILTSDFLFGRYRWTLISEVYELLQSIFSLRAIVSVMRHPRAPGFNVTPKGERIDEDTISALAGPFYIVYAFVLIGTAFGIWKLLHGAPHRDVIIAALGWSGLNLILLNACLGVLYERKQRRAVPRVPASLDAMLHVPPASADKACETEAAPPLACRVVDLSAGGLKLVIPAAEETRVPRNGTATLELFNPAVGRVSRISLMVRNTFAATDGSLTVGAQFADTSVAGMSEQVALVFGDSGRWRAFRESRNRRVGILRSLGIIVSLGTVHAFGHYRVFFGGMLRYAALASRLAFGLTRSLRFIRQADS
ncbi:cellulose synthase (UDP-forming) [Trinickia symbiotica]|uniref:Cellulose synthase catalytic subunit [UDP-forming] n=1 Tax=Trinickia symbiotica TaxID=863227 RepID=A0A2N7X9U3_9BURK|nr:UDP-forming cellulose synthase catalytic subunit [Trinickia symbiotica]PMS38381.1 cellulose synthase catalytic subunit (UDP-forming) [Trinickia symbiotica]PPK42019.1 cellulose synthase (UDP-forming) [Trinickia symbiotica]